MLREFRDCSRAQIYAVLEIEADYWRLIDMAMKTDAHSPLGIPSLEVEIRVSVGKAPCFPIYGQDATTQIQTL
jgi:hypothetical protein